MNLPLIFAVTDFQYGVLVGSAVVMAFLLPAMWIMNYRWHRMVADRDEWLAEYQAGKDRDAGGPPRWGEDDPAPNPKGNPDETRPDAKRWSDPDE